MLRIFIALTLILSSLFNLSAQDVLIDKKGNELPCKILDADKKYFSYKGYQDPEFTTLKTRISRYRKIRYADGREVKISPHPTGWIFAGLGPAVPIGAYASSSADNPYSGFAKTNVGLQFEAAFPTFGKRKQWSIVGVVGGFSNELNGQGKQEWYQDKNGQSVYSGHKTSKHSNEWKMVSALVGVGYTIPVSWKFSVDQKIAAGPGIAHKYNDVLGFRLSGSNTEYRYYSYGEVKNGDTLRAKSTTIAINYGAAVRYFITRSIAFRFGVDFQYAAPYFNIHQYVTPQPPSGAPFDPSRTETVHSKIFVMRLQFGVCFNLVPKNIDYGIQK